MGPRKVPPLTQPVEDYLKAIYELEQRDGTAGTSSVADALDVAPASVTGMVRKLAAQGLLDHMPYHGVSLTPLGRRAALRTIRRHRILESYLTQVLGVPWETVHGEAERLEHAASDDLIERMAAALGHPTVDPHGAPIPTASGEMDETRWPSLADFAVGVQVRVVQVRDRDPVSLRALAQRALHPGVEVRILARAERDGTLTVSHDGVCTQMGPKLAAQVLVEPMPECADLAGLQPLLDSPTPT